MRVEKFNFTPGACCKNGTVGIKRELSYSPFLSKRCPRYHRVFFHVPKLNETILGSDRQVIIGSKRKGSDRLYRLNGRWHIQIPSFAEVNAFCIFKSGSQPSIVRAEGQNQNAIIGISGMVLARVLSAPSVPEKDMSAGVGGSHTGPVWADGETCYLRLMCDLDGESLGNELDGFMCTRCRVLHFNPYFFALGLGS